MVKNSIFGETYHTLVIDVEDLPKNSKSPILTYCRKLISEGYDPDLELHIYRKNQPEPDLIISNIGLASKLTVQETQHLGPVFAKFKEFDLGSLKKKKKKLEGDA